MIWESMAGCLVGEGDNTVVLKCRETGERKKLRLKGRYYYVKKCQRDHDIGGIEIPEKTQKDTTCCLVLGVGSGCGKPAILSERQTRLCDTDKEYNDKMTPCAVALKPLEKVYCPDMASLDLIYHSPYATDEFFVHETICYAAIED